ncbi:hypothetical protein [uncultured Cycloclasticus sp.]|uniref:hypothetical protein n=1 Tax=uncultured Cycloclasticus sp. TaxID=172194 RepID=UPI00258C4351|nr:hypothetical protein [uncultured Cycloclasticus sp.]
MKKVMFLVVGMMFASSVNAASVNFYNSLATFEATHFSGSLEQFEDATLNAGLSITSSNGSVSYSGGVMQDRLTRSSGNSTTFEFGSAVNAFGGIFDLGVAGFGQGIEFTIQAFQGSSEVLSQQFTGNGFFGFITDASNLFNKVIFTAGSSSGSAETYTLDDLHYGLHTAAVPVPAALFLFAPALLGFLGLRRKAAVAA